MQKKKKDKFCKNRFHKQKPLKIERQIQYRVFASKVVLIFV